MAEYISRNYIKKMARFESAYTMESQKDKETLFRIIDDAPVADVAPVVHGHWKKDRDTIKCTVCGFGMFPNRYTFMNGICVKENKLPKYCENCGAKMKGGAEDAI